MQEDKFGKLIKEIRKKNNLTQKDLADKYFVTYQAVSKWENGKSIPDVTILKKISEDFNVSLDDLIDGNLKKKRKNNIFILVSLIVIVLILLIIIITKDKDFKSKTISSSCGDFNISGIISYNEKKSVIYIPKIEYCGENNQVKYKKIDCTLYEKSNDIIKQISSYNYDDQEITLDEFMRKVTFNIDNYLTICKNYNNDSFYLEIKAIDINNQTFYHTVGLKLENNCN